MKIDTLEAGKTYKLIDKEGYFGKHSSNTGIYDKYFVNDSVTLAGVDEDGGYIHGSEELIIMQKEIIFFELVEEESFFEHMVWEAEHTNNLINGYKLWDGEEDIKIGMGLAIVGINVSEFIVEQINKVKDGTIQYLLREEVGRTLRLCCYKDLRSLLPKPEDEFSNKILNKIQKSHPDFYYSTSWDIKEIAKMCYKELMEGKDDK